MTFKRTLEKEKFPIFIRRLFWTPNINHWESCNWFYQCTGVYYFSYAMGKVCNFYFEIIKEEFEDAKGAIRNRISKKSRQHNGQKKKVQKDKQRSTKHTY
jgi:hypothetical protein